MSGPKPTAAAEAPANVEEITIATEGSLWQWLRTPVLFLAGVLAVLVSMSSVWALNVIQTVGTALDDRKLDPGQTRSIDPWDGVEARNVLVLGSDSREGLTPEQQAAFGTDEDIDGQRSDTIILLSIDPEREQAVVVHFPRDLRVEIPGYGIDKINAAYTYGGPDLVIKTVKAFSGLQIHNYMEIDLAGFQRLVDTLGGVKICVDRPMFDELAGLAIPEEGCYLMDGAEALAFVRARHVEGDTIPDFSRIRRQQQFLRAMMNRLVSLGSLLNDEVIEDAVGAVKTDASLTATELIQLGRKLRALAEQDPSGAETLDLRVVPGDTATIGDVSYVVAEQPETRELFEALQRGRPLGNLGQELALTAPAPAIIRVRVLPVMRSDPGEAEALLRRAGFIVLASEGAVGVTGESEIIFKSGARSRAEVVRGYFPGLRVRRVPSALLGPAEVAVVVGDDFASRLTDPAEPES